MRCIDLDNVIEFVEETIDAHMGTKQENEIEWDRYSDEEKQYLLGSYHGGLFSLRYVLANLKNANALNVMVIPIAEEDER